MVSLLLDAMLSKLGRWLRLLGCDVEIVDSKVSDSKILEIARESGRIFITRDKKLFERAVSAGLKSVLVLSDDLPSILNRLSKMFNFNLSFNPDKSRCPSCNTPVLKVRRPPDYSSIPRKVLASKNCFWICPNCGKVYWIGSHYFSILRVLDKAKSSSPCSVEKNIS